VMGWFLSRDFVDRNRGGAGYQETELVWYDIRAGCTSTKTRSMVLLDRSLLNRRLVIIVVFCPGEVKEGEGMESCWGSRLLDHILVWA